MAFIELSNISLPERRTLLLFTLLVNFSFGQVAAEVIGSKSFKTDDPTPPVMQCRADFKSNFPDASIPPKRDRRCLVAPAEIGKSRWSAVIDTRNPKALTRGQIPDAVNMTVSEIFATTALMIKPILIYEQGMVQADAEILCARLQERGFKYARVLSGGYVGWARTQRNADLLAAAEISSADLMGELSSGSPLLVVLGDEYAKAPFGSRVLRLRNTDSAAVIGAIKGFLGKPDGRSVSRVIVIGEPNIADSQWLTWLADPGVSPPVLFYRSTPKEFSQALASLQSLWARQARGPAMPKGCSAS